MNCLLDLLLVAPPAFHCFSTYEFPCCCSCFFVLVVLFLLFIASCSGFSCFSFLLFLFCFSPLFLCLSLRPCDFSCFCCFSCLLSSCGVLFACFTIAFAFYGLCCLFCSSFSSLEFVLLYSCCSGFLSSFLYFSYSCCLFSALLVVHCFTLRTFQVHRVDRTLPFCTPENSRL